MSTSDPTFQLDEAAIGAARQAVGAALPDVAALTQMANGGNGGWDYIGLPPGFQYNSWVTLTITTVPGTGYEYKVTDANSRRGVSIQSPFYDSTETSISNVILEAYNYGASYNVFWNNLSFVSSSFQCSPKSTQPQQSGLFGLLGALLQQQQHLLNHPW